MLVCFERNYRAQHMQVNMVPVPKDCVKALKGAFFNQAAMAGIELSVVEEDQDVGSLF